MMWNPRDVLRRLPSVLWPSFFLSVVMMKSHSFSIDPAALVLFRGVLGKLSNWMANKRNTFQQQCLKAVLILLTGVEGFCFRRDKTPPISLLFTGSRLIFSCCCQPFQTFSSQKDVNLVQNLHQISLDEYQKDRSLFLSRNETFICIVLMNTV